MRKYVASAFTFVAGTYFGLLWWSLAVGSWYWFGTSVLFMLLCLACAAGWLRGDDRD